MPLVALYGLDTDQELVAAMLAGIGVGLTFWMLGRLPIGRGSRIVTTVFLAAGTVFWWTAVVGTTWYFAHIVALDLMVLAIGIALGGDRGAVHDEAWDDDEAADVAVASDGRLRRWSTRSCRSTVARSWSASCSASRRRPGCP